MVEVVVALVVGVVAALVVAAVVAREPINCVMTCDCGKFEILVPPNQPVTHCHCHKTIQLFVQQIIYTTRSIIIPTINILGSSCIFLVAKFPFPSVFTVCNVGDNTCRAQNLIVHTTL